jgi:hypothetical protein
VRPRTSGSLAAALVAAAVLLADRAPDPRRSAAPAAPAAPVDPDVAPPPVPPRPPAVPLAPLAASSPPPDAALLRGGEGERRPPSSTERLLASWSADELALFARVEVLTGRPPPPGVLALVRQRQAGATPEMLREAAMHALAGDPLARAAALEWARTAARP